MMTTSSEASRMSGTSPASIRCSGILYIFRSARFSRVVRISFTSRADALL